MRAYPIRATSKAGQSLPDPLTTFTNHPCVVLHAVVQSRAGYWTRPAHSSYRQHGYPSNDGEPQIPLQGRADSKRMITYIQSLLSFWRTGYGL